MINATLTRKELQAALKTVREDWDIDINLRASTDKLQEIYTYWVESGRIAIKQEVKRLRKLRVYFMKNTEKRSEIEAKINTLWAEYDALEASETTDEETLETTVTTPETAPDTINEPQDNVETTVTTPETVVEPLSEAEYEAKRNALITDWQECQSKINDEKSAKYEYVAHCQKQGVEADTTSFDEFITHMRDKAKSLDTKIKQLDSKQGLADKYYYGI